jgi:argonaute-like protein implicated in RNA metabolism and viral defense
VAAYEGLGDGGKLRLIFHVPRRPGKHEERAVLNAVGKLPRFEIDFALVHVNDDHHFQAFDPSNKTGTGWRGKEKAEAALMMKRGLCLALGPDERLVTCIGADQYRGFGSPGPVLVRLDKRSTIKDVDYVAQQLYHLSFMNVGSLNPGFTPATIAYAEKLARLTGHLRAHEQWSVDLIHLKLGRRLWFV